MKSRYLLAALAYVLRAEAGRALGADVAARQWGEGGGGFGGGWGGGGGGGSTCEWTDHCLGDPCDTENDCDGDLVCSRGVCANPGGIRTTARTTVRPTIRTTVPIRTTTVYVTIKPTETSNPTCEWTGHCAGDPCETENDCDGQLICRSGKCGAVPTTIVTSTRRVPTTTRRVTTPPVATTTRRTSTPVVSRSTVPPQPTTTRDPTAPTCGDNPLACIGVSCETDADCGFSLIICKDGICGL